MRKLLVLLAAVAFVVAFTVPAMSADWGFYGSARMTTFMNDVDPGGGGASDSDLTWDLQGNSRFGGKAKAGDISGGFEYGTGINLRKLFGTVKLGTGTLLIGQTYSPVNLFYSNQVWGGDTGMLNTGGVYGGRNPMIQYATGPFKVALVKPKTGNVVAAATNTNTTIPKIEAAYSFKAGPAALAIQVGYNSYEEEVPGGDSYDISSYVAGLGFNVGFGAGYVKGNIYTGSNTGNYGLWQRGAASATYNAAKNDIDDNSTMGYLAVVGYKVNPKMALEFGYGSNEHESDVTGAKTDDCSAYYVQMTYNLAKGAFIVPEIGMVDLGDDSAGNEEGDITYYGAKWQINF